MKNKFLSSAMAVLSVCLLLTAFSINSVAQTSPGWVLDNTVSNIKVYHKLTKCGDLDVVYLKFVNQNAGSKSISWDATYTTNKATPTTNPFGRQTLTVPAGEIEGDGCTASTNRALYTVAWEVGEGNAARIDAFSIANITVE